MHVSPFACSSLHYSVCHSTCISFAPALFFPCPPASNAAPRTRVHVAPSDAAMPAPCPKTGSRGVHDACSAQGDPQPPAWCDEGRRQANPDGVRHACASDGLRGWRLQTSVCPTLGPCGASCAYSYSYSRTVSIVCARRGASGALPDPPLHHGQARLLASVACPTHSTFRFRALFCSSALDRLHADDWSRCPCRVRATPYLVRQSVTGD